MIHLVVKAEITICSILLGTCYIGKQSLLMGMRVTNWKLTFAIGLSFLGGVFFLLGVMLYFATGSVGGFLFFRDGFLLFMYLILGIVTTGASLLINNNPNKARILGAFLLGSGIFSLLGAMTKIRVFVTLLNIPRFGDVTASIALALPITGGLLLIVAGGLAVFCREQTNALVLN